MTEECFLTNQNIRNVVAVKILYTSYILCLNLATYTAFLEKGFYTKLPTEFLFFHEIPCKTEITDLPNALLLCGVFEDMRYREH